MLAMASRARARCADGEGTLTPLFFSDDWVDVARAKAICAKCQRRSACLRDALERGDTYGVWGGELFSAGAIVEKRPTGRPPKHLRAPLEVDEMGIVHVLPDRRRTTSTEVEISGRTACS